MISRTLRRQRWICASCLRNTQTTRAQSQLSAAAAAAAARKTDLFPASFAPVLTNDDKTLRRIFDSQPFWKEFKARKESINGERAGLFQNRYLVTPEGFKTHTHATLRKCRSLVKRILAAREPTQFKSMARDFDRLSDLLCRIIDLSDFVRATHPDRSFQAAATMAYATMFEYMNELNTDIELNSQLKRAAAMPEVTNTWSNEEKEVASILIQDFAKSAIELPEKRRRNFVDMSSRIADIGTDFVENMWPETPFLKFKADRMKGMDPSLIKSLSDWGTTTIPVVGSAAMMALRSVEDDDVRRAIYTANRTASHQNIRRLDKMLAARSDLSQLCGYKSFAHMTLSDKMAKTPEAVNTFLQALLADTKPQVQEELQDLLDIKASDAHESNFSPNRINAWDREFYTTRLLQNLHSRARSADTLSAYFSLGTVFQGLSRLFSRLYGIRFVPRETLPGETWNSEIRRIDVIDDTAGHIAVMYCDLFARQGKSPNPAHFTLRCSRALLPSEVAEFADTPEPFTTPAEAATDGMAHVVDPLTGIVHQLPTIALICNFARPSSKQSYLDVSSREKPALLSFHDVQTLFHEMGHAVHSMLGRTSLQNVAGTRCATDFAELPSVLMESFAFQPDVLGMWARHYQDDTPIPYQLVKQRLDLEKRMEGAETEAQILLAFLDQALHSRPWNQSSNSTQTYHDVYNQFGSVPEPAGTAWQGFFGHLYGYGAVYYSYLFDRAIAGRVWKSVFKSGDDALSREAGEKYKREVLSWGGSRDGWKCLAGVLDQPELAHGGKDAMREVGRWGIGSRDP